MTAPQRKTISRVTPRSIAPRVASRAWAMARPKAARNTRADREEVDDFTQVLLGLVRPRHIGEGDSRTILASADADLNTA